MSGYFCCSYLDSVSSFWWSIWELKDVWSGFCTCTCNCCWFPFPNPNPYPNPNPSHTYIGYPIYVHLAQGQVVVDHELLYHDTFSAYPVYVSVLHGYGQCWKILRLKLWQLSLILKWDYLRVQLDLEDYGWLVLVRKLSIAKLGSLPACLALIRALLIVWICLSIKPFDFGNFGDDMMWSNCHCWANSLNASLEYCGQLSLTTQLGIPCSENICFIFWYDHITCCQAIHFPYDRKFTVIISNYQIFMIIAVKQICADNFPCSVGDVMWLWSFLWLCQKVFLAYWTILDHVLDICINLFPVYCIFGLKTCFFNTLMAVMLLVQDNFLLGFRNNNSWSLHDDTIVDR